MNNWYECKVKYEKTLETGTQKKVTEAYLVDAMSFTEAENRIIEEMTPYIVGEFEVAAVKKARISELSVLMLRRESISWKRWNASIL